MNSQLPARMGIAPVRDVMDNANLGRTAIWNPGVSGYQGGFGFGSTDNGDCKNYPQGIASTRDAVGAKDSWIAPRPR